MTACIVDRGTRIVLSLFDRSRRMAYRSAAAFGALTALSGVALGQSFANGNFQTGNFTGWTITATANGKTNVQTVSSIDIDGPVP